MRVLIEWEIQMTHLPAGHHLALALVAHLDGEARRGARGAQSGERGGGGKGISASDASGSDKK